MGPGAGLQPGLALGLEAGVALGWAVAGAGVGGRHRLAEQLLLAEGGAEGGERLQLAGVVELQLLAVLLR